MKRRIHVLRTRKRFAQCCAAMAVLFATAVQSHAADKFWGNTAGGNFSTSANWQSCGFFCNPVAGPNDVAHFGLSDPGSPFQFVYTVTFSATTTTNNSLAIEDDFVMFDLKGHTYATTANSGNVIGTVAGRSGGLTITDGTWNLSPADAFVDIGAVANAPGGLAVSAGGRITGSPFIIVGSVATGTLSVQNGGTIPSASVTLGLGSAGTATVTGAGSFLGTSILNVGGGAPGTLNITAGGRVESAGDNIVGFIASGPGTVNVSGANSQWNNLGNLLIGKEGQGAMNVTAGGFVSSLIGQIGERAGSVGTVTVAGAGSRWRSMGSGFGFDVGFEGTATLNIQAGGAVESTGAIIGRRLGSVGTVKVTGAGSTWTDSGAALLIGFGGSATLEILDGGVVSDGNGFVGSDDTVTVDGSGSMWTNSGNVVVGNLSGGVLNITGGGKVSSVEGFINSESGAAAAVTVDGPGSTWTNSGPLAVGSNPLGGAGMLTISGGGAVSNTNGTIGVDAKSVGTVTVTGADSQWINSGELSIGRDGNGTLDITGGGRVQNSSDGFIGRSSGSGSGSGTVTVHGAGSTWTNTARIIVGQDSEGSLSVEAGGSVTTLTGIVGEVAGSHGTATIDGPGSTLTTSGVLAVSNGTLTISNGGVVTTNGLFGTLGAAVTSDAEMTVVGQGSSWNLNSALLTVGFGGTAAVNILDGGNVVNLDARIAVEMESNGTVSVSGAGSRWTIGGRLGVGGNASTLISGGDGTLNIQPGATVSVAQNIVIFAEGLLRLQGGTLDAAEISVQSGGQFQFTSGTLHVGTFNGTLTNQGGTLAPGHSAGTTTINGSYAQQSAAALQMEIGGTTPGTTYDVVNISGIAGISGQLQLDLLGSFIPGVSDTFTVLSATGGIFGTFANVANGQRLGTVDGVGSFLIHYGLGSALNPNQIILTGFQLNPLPGDYDFDGDVDAADYVLWRKNDGTPAGYNTWRTHFGQTIGSSASANTNGTVPEPATSVLLMLTTVCRCLRQRRAT